MSSSRGTTTAWSLLPKHRNSSSGTTAIQSHSDCPIAADNALAQCSSLLPVLIITVVRRSINKRHHLLPVHQRIQQKLMRRVPSCYHSLRLWVARSRIVVYSCACNEIIMTSARNDREVICYDLSISASSIHWNAKRSLNVHHRELADFFKLF